MTDKPPDRLSNDPEQPVLRRGAAGARHRHPLRGRRKNQRRGILRQRRLGPRRGRQGGRPQGQSADDQAQGPVEPYFREEGNAHVPSPRKRGEGGERSEPGEGPTERLFRLPSSDTPALRFGASTRGIRHARLLYWSRTMNSIRHCFGPLQKVVHVRRGRGCGANQRLVAASLAGDPLQRRGG